jgi:hypothetical protein
MNDHVGTHKGWMMRNSIRNSNYDAAFLCGR